MDPFNEVKEDAYSTIEALEAFISGAKSINADVKSDFNNNYQELQEIYEDLQQAVRISESNPQQFSLSQEDINERNSILVELEKKISRIKESWDVKVKQTQREVTSMANRISQDIEVPENPFADNYENMSNLQQQQLIDEQDVHLGAIHDTMRNLNQQAQIMGTELEDQAYELDELDREIDDVQHKMSRGLKRIGYVIEKNRERASDWCIGILVVALCILLILVIAV